MDSNVGEPVPGTNPIVDSADNPSGTAAQAGSITPPIASGAPEALGNNALGALGSPEAVAAPTDLDRFAAEFGSESSGSEITSPPVVDVSSPINPVEATVADISSVGPPIASSESTINTGDQLSTEGKQATENPFPTPAEITPKPEELTPADELRQKISNDIDDFLAKVTKEPVAA